MKYQKLWKFFGLLFVVAVFIVVFSTNAVKADYEISDGSIKGLYHLESSQDQSGNGNNLTALGSPSFIPAKLNYGVNIVSTSTYFTAPADVLTYYDLSNFSVNGWFNLYATSTNNFFFSTKATIGNYHTATLSYNGVAFDFNLVPNTYHLFATSTLSTSTWYMVTATYNGLVMSVYLNSNLLATSSFSYANVLSGSRTFYFSGQTTATTNGILDEWIFTRNVLSTSTINSLYNNGFGQQVCTTVGCGGSVISTSTSSTIDLSRVEALLVIALCAGIFLFVRKYFAPELTDKK